ncbi:MAG TPA: HAMP domain-containing sensor histidine kinase [Ktedonobacterales bacterium]
MRDIGFVSTADREIYIEYDRQRRLRVAQTIATFLCILAIIAAILFLIQSLLDGSFFRDLGLTLIEQVIDFLLPALFGLAILMARQQRVNLAIGLVVGTTTFAVLALNIIEGFLEGDSLLGYLPLPLAIILVGLLGGRRLIIAMSLFIAFFTIAAFNLTPLLGGKAPGAFIAGNALYVLLVTLLVEMGVAALMLVGSRTYRQTFQELGDLRVAMARARQLDELKDQFISSVNHELRTPVMALQGYVELYRLTGSQLPPDEQTELITRASQAGKDLVTLINSILDARRLDQGANEFMPEVVDIRAALEAAIRLVDAGQGESEPRDLHVSIPEELAIWGEQTRLRQILTNLLSNALKYSPSGSPIEVTATIEGGEQTGRLWGFNAPDQPMVHITVRDHGLGIPPEQIPLLFNRFVRLPRDLASNVVGNGLGLYLCAIFAQAMKGRIWAESTGVDGEGSTFFVSLPLARAKK